MKKSRSLWVTLGMIPALSLALAACGGNEADSNNGGDGNGEASGENNLEDFEVEAEEGAELTLWSDGDEQLEWAEEMAASFEEEHGITVDVEEVSQEDAPERLATDGPSGQAADVFASTHDRIGRAISAGLVLENFWPEEYEENFLEASIEATSFDGMLYGYPTGIETYALFYNEELVDEEPGSMDEMIDMAAEMTEGDQYGFMMEPANFYFNYAFIGGYGGYVFGDDNTNVDDIGLNNEGAVEGVELLTTMRDEVLSGLTAEDITADIKTALFEEGSLGFDIDGPWAVRGYEDAGVDFNVMPLPELSNGEVPTSFSGTRGFYVNSYSEFPDAASLLAQHMSSEESLLAAFETTGQLPPHVDIAESDEIQSDEIASAFLEQAQSAVPMPNVPEMPLVWEPMESAVIDVWNNDADIQEALDQAVSTIETAIEEQQQ
jgi:arabinogalactan oligomer / maltooligosaccharide transport system substrate-binding protein